MKTSREKVMDVINRKNVDFGVMWTGHPSPDTVPIFAKEWGIEPNDEAIFRYLQDDCRHYPAGFRYNHPEGIGMFDPGYGIDREKSLGSAGCFSEVEDISELEKYPWPKLSYCDFTDAYSYMDNHQDKMIFTGMWSPFFHIMADFFGMENYFCLMYENPKLIEAATEKIVDF